MIFLRKMINVPTLFYYSAIIINLLEINHTSGFPHTEDLYEGSQCVTENGAAGICKKLPDCPSRLADALAGRRGGDAAGRCGFESYIEIVCCPLKLVDKINVRPAEIACQEYENEVTSGVYPEEVGASTQAVDAGKINPLILSGTRAAAGEFPFMAALGYENTDGELPDPIVYDCGGTLISSKYVLTAAHCISNINDRVPKWVRLGSVDIRNTGAQEIPVSGLMAHPKYRRSQNYNDIALVVLQVSARMSPNVKPICLQTRALQNTNVDSKTSFVTIGFGATALDELRSEKLMKSANLNLVPITVCNESYTAFGKLPIGIDDTMICAVDANSTRGSDACQGDSGGPLLMVSGNAHTVLAVTSFGQSCGSVTPGVYTSVHAFLDWIEEKVWPERTKT